jgi:hypothetical protein
VKTPEQQAEDRRRRQELRIRLLAEVDDAEHLRQCVEALADVATKQTLAGYLFADAVRGWKTAAGVLTALAEQLRR